MNPFGLALLWTIGIAITAWLLLSPLLVIYWVFFPQYQKRFLERHKYVTYGIFFGAFFGSLFIIGSGVEKLLEIIPSDWGSLDEDGEFVTTRRSISIPVGFFLTLLLESILSKYVDLRTDNRKMKMRLRVYEETNAIHISRLSSAADEYQEKLDAVKEDGTDFASIEPEGKHLEEEIQFLRAMIEEIAKRQNQLAYLRCQNEDYEENDCSDDDLIELPSEADLLNDEPLTSSELREHYTRAKKSYSFMHALFRDWSQEDIGRHVDQWDGDSDYTTRKLMAVVETGLLQTFAEDNDGVLPDWDDLSQRNQERFRSHYEEMLDYIIFSVYEIDDDEIWADDPVFTLHDIDKARRGP